MTETFRYFAFGSNMLTERLRVRCKDARPVGRAHVEGHRITFFKRSADESGKAMIEQTDDSNDVVHGVLFDIPRHELEVLDKHEGVGKGYWRKAGFEVIEQITKENVPAMTYMAEKSHIVAGLQPYDWYKALILAGAEQHGLPKSYIEDIRSMSALVDPDKDRRARGQAIEILNKAGYAYLLQTGTNVAQARAN